MIHSLIGSSQCVRGAITREHSMIRAVLFSGLTVSLAASLTASLAASLLIWLAISGPAHSSTAIEPIRSNSLRAVAENEFQVTGRDPHLVLPVDRMVGADEVATELVLQLAVERRDEDLREIPLEIFYRPLTDNTAGQTVFDPLYRIQFKIPSSNSKNGPIRLPIRLPLRADMQVATQQLRLDIDSCKHCKVTLNALPSLQSAPQTVDAAPGDVAANTADPEADTVANKEPRYLDLRIISGTQPIPTAGLEVANTGWQLNDMQALGEYASVSGNDPFMVSPILDAAVDDLAGILIEIQAPVMASPNFDFQLFYATEKHNFVERASSFMRVKANADNAPLQFYVPLAFLSQQSPGMKLLKRLRLDLATQPKQQQNATWSMPKMVLISNLDTADYQELVPGQLIHNKLQKSSRRQMLLDILDKLGSDLVFSIFYTLLLIAVVLISMRKFRSA